MDKTEPLSLTKGERLLISRRRAHESQSVAARRYGLSRNRYGEMERDADAISDNFSVPEVGQLSVEEKCLILRRRSERTQEDCAAELGVTRFWYNQMEMGNVPSRDLASFWGIAA